MFFVICNFVYVIGINDSLLSIFIYFSKTQIKKEKLKVFWQIFTWHGQIKINRKYIKLHTLHCIHFFSFFLIDVVSIFLTIETFKTSFTSQLNLFWIEKLLYNGIFKKFWNTTCIKLIICSVEVYFSFLKFGVVFILTLNDSKSFILTLKVCFYF